MKKVDVNERNCVVIIEGIMITNINIINMY